jgi:NAD(P)-dependent dehydrogenase (short-subunit alcohol dehydrogenase family)
MARLDGKVAIISGGARGQGAVEARMLAQEGAKVVFGDILDESGRQVEAELAEAGLDATYVHLDVTSEDDWAAAVQSAVAKYGRLDILVNNAAAPGGIARGPLETISDNDVLNDLNTKVVGYLRCARAVAPHMTENGWGRIVNIGGLSARNSSGSNVSAGVRNSGLVNLTKYLAQELGASGITVNLIHPGATRTERSGPAYEEQARREGITVEEVEARVAANNSTKRIVDASELAYVVAFFASPRSIAISGEAIAAGGGAGTAVHH